MGRVSNRRCPRIVPELPSPTLYIRRLRPPRPLRNPLSFRVWPTVCGRNLRAVARSNPVGDASSAVRA